MANFFPEMSLFDENGKRLYLTDTERKLFLEASKSENRENRVFCSVLHYTGCRLSEALELTPRQISIQDQAIIIRTLKKRKHDKQGREKKPQFRSVPVPSSVVNFFDLVFDLRRRQQRNNAQPFWNMSRTTAWQMVKKVMDRAGISGPQATPKGLPWLRGCHGHKRKPFTPPHSGRSHGPLFDGHNGNLYAGPCRRKAKNGFASLERIKGTALFLEYFDY